MKVLLDYFIFDATSIGGVHRYFSNLISQSKGNSQVEYKLGCFFGESSDGIMQLGLKKRPFANSGTLDQVSRKLSRQVNILYTIGLSMGSKYDIFHPTGYTLGIPAYLKALKKPLAISVYDMVPEIFPDLSNTRRHTSTKKKFLCEKAEIIFAISEHTKNDLIRLFNISPEKITVTHLAGGFESPVLVERLIQKLPSRYILHIGWRQGYKNFNRFFSAIVPILKKDAGLSLVCTGPSFTLEEKGLFKHYGLESRVCHHLATDLELYTLYHLAEAFIFPSLYEGFGIPLLEAFSSGCPVAASNTSSLPEVGGNAAVYFDPKSESDITSSIQSIIYNPDFRSELIQAGFKRAGQFSWNKTMEITIEGYRSILSR